MVTFGGGRGEGWQLPRVLVAEPAQASAPAPALAVTGGNLDFARSCGRGEIVPWADSRLHFI